jgi:hypothetical protein
MNAGQYEGIVGRLDAILNKMPAVPQPDPRPFTVHHLDGTSTVTGADHPGAQRLALGVVLQTLDGWIRGCKENHGPLGHPLESRGEECWRTFAPSDIRNMINDAATEMGLAEFPEPTEPEENTP